MRRMKLEPIIQSEVSQKETLCHFLMNSCVPPYMEAVEIHFSRTLVNFSII